MALGITSTQDANTPSIIAGNGSTGVTVLAYNAARIGFSIQNVGTTTAWIRIDGNQAGSLASSTVYHYAIHGGSSDNDGTGGSISFFGVTVPTGLVTMYGASTAKVTALEIAP